MKSFHSFRISKVALAVAAVVASQAGTNVAHAGAGWGDNLDFNGNPIKTPTFYANSPSGLRNNTNPYLNGGTGTVDTGKALRKFVDTLPGLTPAGANNLGQYMPIATADTTSYPGSDYYEIAVVEYSEKMHSDLPKGTTLRGYVQIETPANAASSKHIALTYPNGSFILDAAGNQIFAVDNPHYLGPVVLASKGRAVRYKFMNLLPLGGFDPLSNKRNGDLFLPIDQTLLGANTGPDGVTKYAQNRAEIHLHGGDSPWISDGTPHQWITPRGEATPYKRGVSTQNVPDMPDPGEGAVTYYYPNNQSARLMFYHDHTSGLTRLNVYGGEAAGYVLLDPVEQDLITRNVIPGLADMIPLVIQDKTFVPADIAEQDARWDPNHWGQPGDLWFPHVYETNQDPNSFDGTNPVGRWDYGPWFWPVFPAPLPLPTGVYGDVSTTPEAFMDTPVVNGTAYPTLNVDPKAYRFRVLNAANDRFLNLGLYVADPTVTTADGRTNTEVKMVPAAPAASALPACAANQAPPTCWPSYWPADGRPEGVPDPTTVGPDIVVIGNEGGLIPHPHVIPSSPVVFELNRRSVTVLNVLNAGLYLGNAERADAIIDFSQYAGKTLILYNDAPAPVPAFDPRIDYFTGNSDLTGAGGAESTKAGFGPNTRTIMQIKVAAATPAAPFDVAKLQAELPVAYGKGSDHPVVGQVAYNAAFGTTYGDTFAKIRTGSGQQPDFIWTPTGVAQSLQSIQVTDGGVGYIVPPTVNITGGGGTGATAVATIASGRVTSVTLTNPGTGFTSAPFVSFTSDRSGGLGATASVFTSATQRKTVQNKAIQELFDPDYGRMNATLGVELPFTTALTQTTVPLGYVDPATEILTSGETQIWKITHNGVDTHPVHFHLMNVQLVNRIGWDGTIKPPSASELGWKETIKMNPLEDIVVAVSPKTPLVPFGVPESTRYRDPAQAPNGTAGFTQIDFKQFMADGVTPNLNFGLTVPGGTVRNTQEFYEWEYVWHCHILGHEENDFMRPIVYRFGALAPDAPTAVAVTPEGVLTWTDATPAADPATMLSKKNEIGFRIERAPGVAPAPGVVAVDPGTGYVSVGTTLANATTFTDTSIVSGQYYWYRVVAYNAKGQANSTAVSMSAISAGTPAAPSGVTATVAGPTTVNLVWTDNSTNETGFVVSRCVADAVTGLCTGALAQLTVTAPNVTAYADTTATPGTTYVYQIVARNAVAPADSAAVPSNIVTTKAAPATAPSGLSAVAAAVGGDTTVVLNWTDNSTNESGFLVERSSNGGATWTSVTTVTSPAVPNASGVTVTFTDSGLTQNSTYLYRVSSLTAFGAATSMPVTVVTNYAPAPVIGVVTPTPQWNQVALSWPVAAPSTAFVINRTGGTVPFAPVTVPGNIVGATLANTWVDTAVIQNTAYSYTITAINGVTKPALQPNIGTPSPAVPVTTLYAPAPSLAGLGANAASTSLVNLNWTPLNAATYVTGVRILRCVQSAANFNCTSPTSVFTQVYAFDRATPTTAMPTSWADTSVLPSTGYTYQAFFVNGPNSGAVAVANASVAASYAMITPDGVTAALSLTQARVTLTWTDRSTNETGFVIERSTDGVNFAQIGTATTGSTAGTGTTRTYNDTMVAPGVVYSYRVKAVNITGAVTTTSQPSAVVTVDMSLGAPSGLVAAVSPTQVVLTWQDNALYQDNFVVLRSPDGGVTWATAGTAAAVAGVGGQGTFTDNALTLIPGQTYTYAVKAQWTFAGVLYQSTQAVTTAQIAVLPAPAAVTAAFTDGRMSVAWIDNAPNETRYEVDRSGDGGLTWSVPVAVAARAGTGSAMSYTDAGSATGLGALVAGTSYIYRVRAVNVTGTVVTPSVAVSSAPLPYVAPPAPAALTATSTVGQTIDLSWPDVATESGYSIQRQRLASPGVTAQPWAAWKTVGANVVTTSDTNLQGGRIYQYRITATNSAGASTAVDSLPIAVMP